MLRWRVDGDEWFSNNTSYMQRDDIIICSMTRCNRQCIHYLGYVRRIYRSTKTHCDGITVLTY